MNVFIKISRIPFVSVLLFTTVSCLNEDVQKSKSTADTDNADHIILINPFEVPDGKLQGSVTYWEACRDFLKKQPGYISTELHETIKDDAKFELINVAVWESPKAFAEASKKMAKELGVTPPEGLRANPSLYTVIRD
ncbi:antibiotic biosynthesis monooxygenase family protein [Flagellimonas myxillae]|uniref:antibiotic biosynthesis monooxygenase family protein n=1 Tax=Flagellimonas myxillae TaxID=2942214 RepID=UPI00201FB39A|nr:antibiotic biosynthesis monooxygenase family protein [Muricauda myxillae]MCL6266916.1 antibiotic biosynthesis monooxygenase [Muricauda myxillae]